MPWSQGEHCSVKVSVSYLEIYNETFTDLLNPGGVIKLRENTGRREGVLMEGATEVEVKSAAETLGMLKEGSDYRHVAATNMNKESSRSHSVFIMKIQTTESEGGRKSVRTSRFNLIDLAGSERQKTAKTAGKELKEASAINKSLSALGNVINALVDKANGKERHIHYRDSKLTFLLKDSLGGNSKTCIITNVSPAGKNSEETLSTLRFAQRAKKIQNAAVVNEITSMEAAELRATIEQLKHEKESLEQQLAAGPAVPKSNEEMERLLQQGFKQHEQMKQENEELAEQLAVATENAANVVKAVQAKDMIIKFRDNKIQQLEKGMRPDKTQFEFEHQSELDALRKFKETNPELAKARYENKNLRKKVKELQNDEVREQMVSAMEELKAYNDGLVKQCTEFGKQKEAMEANMQEVEEMIETQIADLARVRAENQGFEKTIASLQGSKAELESMIEETMNLLETSQNDHNACRAELERVTAESSAWESKSGSLEQQLEHKTTELEASQQTTMRLEQDLAASKAEVATVTDTMNKSLASRQEQIDKLTNECESTKAELAAAIQQHDTTVASLNSQVSELQSSVVTEQEATKAQQALVKTLEDSQQQLMTEKANLEQQLAAQQTELDAATASLEAAQAKLTEREAEAETLTAANTEMEQRVATAESAVATHASQIAGLEAEKSDLNSQIVSLNEALTLKEAALEASQASVQEYVGKVTVIEEELSAAQAEATAAEDKVATLTAAKEELSETLATTRGFMSDAVSDAKKVQKELNEQIAALQAEKELNSTTAAKNTEMETQIAELTAEKEAAEAATRAANEQLQEAQDQLKLSMEEASSASEEALEKVATLSQELEEASKRAADQLSESEALRSELDAAKAQIEKLKEEGSDANGDGNSTTQKIKHLEKVKRCAILTLVASSSHLLPPQSVSIQI